MLYLKYDILILDDEFERNIRNAFTHFGIYPLYNFSLPGNNWHGGLRKTGIQLQIFQYQDLLLTKGNNMRGGISSVKGDTIKTWKKFQDETECFCIDAKNLYGWALCQSIPYKNIKLVACMTLKVTFEKDVYAETGYFVHVDLKTPHSIGEKLRFFLSLLKT